MHDNDKVEGGLMVLFFWLVFSVPYTLEIILPTLLVLKHPKFVHYYESKYSIEPVSDT